MWPELCSLNVHEASAQTGVFCHSILWENFSYVWYDRTSIYVWIPFLVIIMNKWKGNCNKWNQHGKISMCISNLQNAVEVNASNLCILLSNLFYLFHFCPWNVFLSLQIRTSVIWSTPNVSFEIPLWVIILAILLGLLVLALLTLALWKVCSIISVTVAFKKSPENTERF